MKQSRPIIAEMESAPGVLIARKKQIITVGIASALLVLMAILISRSSALTGQFIPLNLTDSTSTTGDTEFVPDGTAAGGGYLRFVASNPGPGPSPDPEPITGQWEEISPPGASKDFGASSGGNYGFHHIAVDRRNPGTVYVGTSAQGFWKSTDSGSNWTKLGAGLLDSGRHWTIGIDSFNSTVYTTMGYSTLGLYRSRDGGNSWQQILPQSLISSTSADTYYVATDPYREDHILVTFHAQWSGQGDSGVIESFDGGDTWTVHQPVPGWETGHYIFFLNNSESWLLATQSPEDGVWKTSDSGKSWRKVATQNVHHGSSQLYRANNGAFYLALSQGIMKSTDNGETWTKVLANLEGDTAWPTKGGYMGIVGDGERMYTNLTTLWQPSAGHSLPQAQPYMMATESDGTDWQPMNSQLFSNGPNSMAYDPTTGYLFSSNWEAGIYRIKLR